MTVDASDLEFSGESEYESEPMDQDEAPVAMDQDKIEKKVYLPGQPLAEGEKLQVDTSVYQMLHSLNVKWPSLSFDIIQDRLGNERNAFPHTCYIALGSQAQSPSENEITLVKMSNLTATKKQSTENDSDSESSDDEDDNNRSPVLQSKSFCVNGGINRIRALHSSKIVAAWTDAYHQVEIYDLSSLYDSLESSSNAEHSKHLKPLYNVKDHKVEGFALDWSSQNEGTLLSGDCYGSIKLTCVNGGSFKTTSTFSGHGSSVEDLQWSPNEATVFASCSTDKTIRLYDSRAGFSPQFSQKVAECDVNVISWNSLVPFFIASGHDDGAFAIWDLRVFSSSACSVANIATPAANFKWHTKAITSIEWHTHEESMIAVSGGDNQVTLWDLSTEKDDDVPENPDNEVNVPDQLLFVHQGQEDVKEIHWHRQIPGCLITTAATGVDIFKTINS